MSPRTALFPAGRLPIVIPVISVAVLAALFGFWPLTGSATAFLPLFAVPAAAGLPFLIPPLRLLPLADTSWGFWAVDNLAALLMLVVVALSLTASLRKRPLPSAARTFGSTLWAVLLGAVIGNIVRVVFASFVVNSDFGTYLGVLGATILVTALFTLPFAALVALVALAARRVRGGARATVEA